MEIPTRGRKFIEDFWGTLGISFKSKAILFYLSILTLLTFFTVYYSFRSISLDDWGQYFVRLSQSIRSI
jgi:hypothetical protein